MNAEKPILDKISYTDAVPVISINKVWGLPWHYHPHVEFIVVLDGAVTLETESERRQMRAGDGALIFPHVPHCYYLDEQPCERFMAVFDPRYYGEFRDIFLHGKPKTAFFTAEQSAAILPPDRKALVDLCNHYPRRGVLDNAERCAKFAVLLAKFLQLCGVADDPSDQALYRAAVNFCTERFYDAQLSVGDVAEALNISRSKLNGLFSEQYGGIKAYINLCRVRHAEVLLRSTDMSIAQVAEKSGFAEIRTFNRAFKKQHGVSPTAYRKT